MTTPSFDSPPRLYRHALESIFVFLPFNDLKNVFMVSQYWYAAVCSTPRLHSTFLLRHSLSSVCASPLRRHISSFSNTWIHARMQLDRESLQIMADRMAHMTSLQCTIKILSSLSQQAELTITFPSRLANLELRMIKPSSIMSINAAIEAISQLSSLQSLTLHLSFDPFIRFTPLSNATQLTHLHLEWQRSGISFTDDQLSDLCHLSSLRSLHLRDSMTPLIAIARLGLTLPVHSLSDHSLMIDSSSESLLRAVPSLTRLGVMWCSMIAPTFFQHVSSSLRQLRLQDIMAPAEDEQERNKRTQGTVDGLATLTQLTDLRLCAWSMNNQQMEEIMAHLQHLQRLQLVEFNDLASLQFLIAPHLTHGLIALEFHQCRNIPASEYERLHEMHSLQELIVKQSCTEQMESSDFKRRYVSSSVTEFQFQPLPDDSE